MQLAEDRTKQILIVEDEGLIAADVQRKLQRLGYPLPVIAQSGAEALRCARASTFDLVLMDIRLKGDMDGIAAAEALKSEFEIPVVYMTAHADQDTIARAKVTEPLGYILKPVTDGDLRSAVQISIYRHQMERNLRTSQAWLSTTLRCVGEGIIATDTAGEIVFMNPLAEKLTGWSAADGRGRLLMDILAIFEEATDRPAKNPVFDLLPGESRNYHLLPRKGTDTVVEVQCFENRLPPAPPQSGAIAGPVEELLGAIVVLRDTSVRRQIEGRLVQSQRMEAVASMAGGLAHDFNNQLMVILGYAEELCTHLNAQDKQAALEIRNAASLASSITRQLLMLSRRGEARFEVINVNRLICEVQPMISHNLGKNRTLVTNLSSPEGFVRCDRNQLKQVLLNLAVNARDAMPGGGELRIESSTVEHEPDSQAARLYRAGQFVRLRVSDSGEGMERATLARIFEPFFSTKKAGLGAGMGLSIAHSIIAQSQGFIRAESIPGHGTVFEILLPCVGTFRGASDATGLERPEVDAESPTILLVEDEDSVRRLMHRFLEREGYQLLEARTAEEAEALAEVYPGPIHVLVADVLMPGMTGPDLETRLLPLRPGLKTLLVSGYRHDIIESRGLPISGLNLLSKPFPATELIRRVRMLLDESAQPVQ